MRPSRLGDLICATPAFRALRAALPEARITLITLPLLGELAVRLPAIDGFEAFPGFPGIAEQFFDARRATRFFRRMQAHEFDLAIQMYESGVYSNPFTLLLGAKWTAGFVRRADDAPMLDAALPIPRKGHEVQRLLALTSFIGAPVQGEGTEFPLWEQDNAAAERLLTGARPPLIGLHPGAREPAMQWPPQAMGRVGASLRERFGGTVVVLGSVDDAASARVVAAHAGRPCVNLAGQTSLAVLGAVIARLHILIANDSGPAHIAYALRTPTVTVVGPSNTERYGPLLPGPFRRVAASSEDLQPGGKALSAVEEDRVLAAAAELGSVWQSASPSYSHLRVERME